MYQMYQSYMNDDERGCEDKWAPKQIYPVIWFTGKLSRHWESDAPLEIIDYECRYIKGYSFVELYCC